MDEREWALACSETSRGAYILAKLDQAAKLRKEVTRLLDEWVEAEAHALFAEWARNAKEQLTVESMPPGRLESD